MIITCPNCNKQFKIDNSLIPDEGRDLQCGSCNHVWFYKIEEINNEVLELNEEIISEDIETKAEKKEEKLEEISEKQKKTTISKNTESNGSNDRIHRWPPVEPGNPSPT